MPGTNNFIQWNNTAANQVNDTSYATAAAAGCAVDSIFASNVANKIFFQVSTFVAAFAQALANQGLNLSDSNISTLTTVLTNIVVGGVGSNPVLGNVTANSLDAASITATTGLQCDAGIVSGTSSAGNPGSYAIYDSAGTEHSGVGGGTPITLAAAISAGYHVCGGLIVP